MSAPLRALSDTLSPCPTPCPLRLLPFHLLSHKHVDTLCSPMFHPALQLPDPPCPVLPDARLQRVLGAMTGGHYLLQEILKEVRESSHTEITVWTPAFQVFLGFQHHTSLFLYHRTCSNTCLFHRAGVPWTRTSIHEPAPTGCTVFPGTDGPSHN